MPEIPVRDGPELWQLPLCSGSLFKMGIFDSHGNVIAAEAIDAAGKIFLWKCRATKIVRPGARAAVPGPVCGPGSRERRPWIVIQRGAGDGCPDAAPLPCRHGPAVRLAVDNSATAANGRLRVTCRFAIVRRRPTRASRAGRRPGLVPPQVDGENLRAPRTPPMRFGWVARLRTCRGVARPAVTIAARPGIVPAANRFPQRFWQRAPDED